jgi:site-specific DNA recombinase
LGLCGSYARHGKKACTAHTIKEDFLKETILDDIQTLIQQVDKEKYIKKMARNRKVQNRILKRKSIRSTNRLMFYKIEKEDSSTC